MIPVLKYSAIPTTRVATRAIELYLVINSITCFIEAKELLQLQILISKLPEKKLECP